VKTSGSRREAAAPECDDSLGNLDSVIHFLASEHANAVFASIAIPPHAVEAEQRRLGTTEGFRIDGDGAMRAENQRVRKPRLNM